MPLFEELRRRNVFRVAAAYLVVGWLLTEVLTTILPTLGAPEWTARAVILIFAFGFVPAVVFSWFFELTPDGIKRDHEIDRETPGTRRPGYALEYATLAAVVVLIVLLGLFSAWQGEDAQSRAVPPLTGASVAVLPFANMSSDEDNEYFSDGLTETLLHMLTQIPDLKVAARTSSFAFKDRNEPVGEIARTLGVAHVLEGSVQRAGDKVRVTAQLIRAQDGFHVWSQVYDRTLDDIFAIQDEIAGEVGKALSASLLTSETGRSLAGVSTADADAYDLYLQALNERTKNSYGSLQGAEDLLKGALTIDPDFLEARTALAYNYLAQIETGLKPETPALLEVGVIADQVLAVDSVSIPARAARLYATTLVKANEGDAESIRDAIGRMESLLAADPDNLEVRVLLVRLLQAVKEEERALDIMLVAAEGDPLNAQVHYELGSLYSGLQRVDEARAALERSLEIEPRQPNAYVLLAHLAMYEGDGVDYLEMFLRAIGVDARDHELPGMVAAFLYELELVEEADDFRKRVQAIAPTSEIAHQIDLLRAIAIGDEAASVASARRAIEADIDDRRFSFAGAVQHLLRVAARNGTVEETMAWLEQQAPGILDVDAGSSPMKYRNAQFMAFVAWYVTLTPAELEAQIARILEIATAYGFDPAVDPKSRVSLLVLRGDTGAAVDIALEEIFTESVATNLGWERTYSQPQYEEFLADPRVQEALQRWEAEEAQLRADVRSFLADLQASS